MQTYYVLSVDWNGESLEQWQFDAAGEFDAQVYISETEWESCGSLEIKWWGTLEAAHDEALLEDANRSA